MLLNIGDEVEKTTGDYYFKGTIVSQFLKLDGKNTRYVVENKDGILLIMNEKQLNKCNTTPQAQLTS